MLNSLALAKKFGCKICPLKQLKNNLHPNMQPTGTDKPILYFLGEAPGGDEDFEGKQFIGQAGQRLRVDLYKTITNYNIPLTDINKYIRWNNIVRCRPYVGKSNRTPTTVEIECCKQSVFDDIEATKPLVVVGFGGVPLKTVTEGVNIDVWANRFVPVKFGKHKCWYYCCYHPSYLVRQDSKTSFFENEYDRYFRVCLNNIFDFVLNKYEQPEIIEDGYEDNISVLYTISEVLGAIEELKQEELIAFDLETDALRPFDGGKILTIAFSTYEKTFAFPIEGYWNEKDLQEIKSKLYGLFINGGEFIAHNLKFELEWLYNIFDLDLLMKGKWHDTMVQAYLLDERTTKTRTKQDSMFKLDLLTYLNFGFRLKGLSTIDTKDITKSRIADILLYNGLDAKYTYLLFQKQNKKLDKELKLCYNNLIETTVTLTRAQSTGVHIDLESVDMYIQKYTSELEDISLKIKELDEVKSYQTETGKEFNPLSPEHIVYIFESILKIPPKVLTKKKNYSTNDFVLGEFAKDGYKIAEYIISYRKINKLKATYLENVKELAKDGILKTQYNLLYTQTGRLSSGKDSNT